MRAQLFGLGSPGGDDLLGFAGQLGAVGGMVGAAWGASASLLLALAGFGIQAWVIYVSPVSQLKHLPASAD